jgi:PKD domain
VSTDAGVAQFDIGAGGLLAPNTPPSVPSGSSPWGVAISPDGRSLYVNNYGGPAGAVSQFDIGPAGLLSPKNPASVQAGDSPYVGVVVSPDVGPVARFSATPAPAGAATHFDGSASSDAHGVVARYDWGFGDGSSGSNAGPSPAHLYAAPGTYTVSLTVSDELGCSTTFIFTGQTAYCGGRPAAQSAQQVVVPGKDTTPPKISAFTLSPVAFSSRRWALRPGVRLSTADLGHQLRLELRAFGGGYEPLPTAADCSRGPCRSPGNPVQTPPRCAESPVFTGDSRLDHPES